MSKDIKLCSGAKAVKKFQRTGWSVVRQKGSHVMLTKVGYPWTLSVPQHTELGPGLLRKLIKQAGISIEKFNSL